MATLKDLYTGGVAPGITQGMQWAGQKQQIQGQKTRNALADLALQYEPTRQANENQLAQLAMGQKNQAMQDAQEQKQLDNLQLLHRSLTALAGEGGIAGIQDDEQANQLWQGARSVLGNVGVDLNGLPEATTAGELMAIDMMVSQPAESTALLNELQAAGIQPNSPEGQQIIRDRYTKKGGTTVNVGTGGAVPTDEFTGAFGDSGEGKRLEIQARALARREGVDPLDAIERVALQKDVSQSERTADTYYQRMRGATSDIEGMENKGFNPTAGDSILEQFPGGNFLIGDEYQQYKATASEWIRAKLRKESGAAIPPEEMKSEFETYFFVPGDGQKTIKTKRELRRRAEQAMAGERVRLGAEEQGGQSESGGGRDRSLDDILSQYGVQ